MNMQATGQTIAAPRPALSPTGLSIPRSKGIVVGFWIVTAPFCLQIGFTGHRRALGALVLLLVPRAGHADERLG
jgi:hypothetical protein